MIRSFLGFIILFNSFLTYADELNCVLPSLKDGMVIEKYRINFTAGRLIVKSQRQSSFEIEDRKVLFHSLDNPVENINGNKLKWEGKTSLILLESKFKNTIFTPDVIFVDWDKGTLKTATPYQDSFTNRWQCKIHEDQKTSL